LEWAALEMLVQKPFFPAGGLLNLPKLRIDGTDTGHKLPLRFTRVIHFDKEDVNRYLTRRERDYTLGKGDLVICYPNFPSIDLFGCTTDGQVYFIQVSMSAYVDKRSHKKDLRALYDERKELGDRSVYDYFRTALADAHILPGVHTQQRRQHRSVVSGVFICVLRKGAGRDTENRRRRDSHRPRPSVCL